MSIASTPQLSDEADVNLESQGISLFMRRLPFRLQDFTRVCWTSDSAREAWEPRIRRISNAWLEIEWLAVAGGLRSCCIANVSPEHFVERAPRWAQNGLASVPLAMCGVAPSYSSTSVAVEAGKPFVFRMVLGSPKDVAEFRAAFDAADDRTIGRLLGYPSCCREFFRRVWVDDAMVDTTWPMAVATPGALTPAPSSGTGEGSSGEMLIEVEPLPKSNILWRWMGVRPVSHLPCSFACPATVELADRLIGVGRKNGFQEEMDWMLEILDWPVEWSALHGVAEIKTPVLKVSTRTDATPCKYTVRYKGRSTPPEAARGLRFPFLEACAPGVTCSDAFRRGLENPISQEAPTPAWYATDNGFSTVAAMQRAHEPIVTRAESVLEELRTLTPDPSPVPGEGRCVLDMGCGNGALLKKLLEANPSIVPFGIDSQADRIAHARELLPSFAENFAAGDLFDAEWAWPEGRRYALALLMPGRFLEVAPARAAALRARLTQRCDRILVYAYGDWLTRHGNLAGLARAAGLRLLDGEEALAAGLAVVSEG